MSGRLVVCAGDSLTRGEVGADWVTPLRRRLPADRFVNAGLNGNLAWNLMRRLDRTVLRHDPDVVTLLIGTNDVQAAYSPATERRYRWDQRIPRKPTQQWYAECAGTILTRLRAESRARIAVLDIPMLGEDLDSPTNDRVRAYNATLRELAAENGAAVLPLHDRLAALLPPGHRPPRYRAQVVPMFRAVLANRVRQRSWDEIAHRNGLAVLTDHIHFSDRAAAVAGDLVAGFLAET